MKEKKGKEELQNRREFFKKAAKKVLPIIGIAALMSNPVIAKAIKKNRWDAIVIALSIVVLVELTHVQEDVLVIVSIHAREHVMTRVPEGVQDTAIIHAAVDVEVRLGKS